MTRCIYLDHNATTPIDPRALDAMLPYLREACGNASSKTHAFGWQANEAVEKARAQVARLLGASSREVVFTSGATESNNVALIGYMTAGDPSLLKNKHVITQQTEHPAVLDPLRVLERQGCEVTYLQPDEHGQVSVNQVRDALRANTALVSIMAANNEIGVLQPIEAIAAVCGEAGVLFHTDAAQAVGKIPIDMKGTGIDLLSLSGHKFYAPKGVGALVVRSRTPRTRLSPILFGGGQEKGLSPGTLNVPGVVGLGAACEIAQEELPEESARLIALRERLYGALGSGLDGVHQNGHPTDRLPGTSSFSFEGVDGAALLISLNALAVSSGSACSSGTSDPSHVLKAIGVSEQLARSTVRFGLGRFTTEEEVEEAARQVIGAVKQLRGRRL